jgi:SAM-dependent methyltransferase
MRRTGVQSSVPFLPPHSEVSSLLVRLPLDKLRAAAEARGIAFSARAGRKQLASLLVIHKVRETTESEYRDSGIAFESKETTYPHLRRLVTKHGIRRILDVGCGPGLFADELRAHAFPTSASYVGVDLSPAAIDLARQRLAEDPRFVFAIADAQDLGARPFAGVDGIIISFLLTYLDTVAADHMVREVAHTYPEALAIVALSFRACVDRLPEVIRDDKREVAAARSYLAGDHAAADGIWDTRRWECYSTSLAAVYETIDERVLPNAQKFWVLRPRPRPRRKR